MSLKKHRTTDKSYTDLNVYEATKARIHFCYENYDEVIVNFSGGKDSQTVVLLAKEVVEERGKGEKVKVVFYDQEFVYPETDKLVTELFNKEWVDGYRLCIPMEWDIVQPDGQINTFFLWDESRTLCRPFPEKAVRTDIHYDITQGERAVREVIFKGKASLKIAQLLGVRCQESITRLSTILASYKKGGQCFLRHSPVARGTDIGSPIYDWDSMDIWHYLKSQQHILPVNELYFIEMISGRPLRVDTPIGGKNAIEMTTLKIKNPKFYELILKVFPELDTTIRYADALAKTNNYNQTIEKYGLTLKGIRQLIEDNVQDPELKLFALNGFKKFIKDYIEYDRYKKYGYTREQALKVCFVSICKNQFGKTIMLKNKVETKKEKKARELLETTTV